MDTNTATARAPSFTAEDKMRALTEVFGEEYADSFQDPVVFMPCVFMSPTVKQFYKREFPLISRTLFVESVYRRRPAYNQAVLDDFTAMVSKKLADIVRLLTIQCDRLREICKSNGAMTDATYMHPEHRIVPIIAGHGKTYIHALNKLDEAYQLVGSAALNGILDGSTRMKTELLCRKAIRAFSAMLRNEIIKLHKESQRMRASLQGQPDAEIDRAEAAHGQAVEKFDVDMQNTATTDGFAHVDPAQAAQVIEDISATNLAASTAAGKTPRGRKKAEEGQPSPAATAPGVDSVVSM